MEWLTTFIQGISWQQIAWGAALFVVTFTVSLAAVGLFVVLLPPTFFLANGRRRFMHGRHPGLRWTVIALKNLLGLTLVVVGLGLSLPGMPGQGLLTILIGLILMDFPGKKRLEQKIIGRPKVLGSINRLRARFKKPPLLLDQNQSERATTDTEAAEGETVPTEGEAVPAAGKTPSKPAAAKPAGSESPPHDHRTDHSATAPERTPTAQTPPDKR